MLLFCVAVNLPPAMNARVIQTLPAMARVYPQLDPATLWSRDVESNVAVGMHNPVPTLGRRRYVAESPERVTFYEGTLVDPRGRFQGNDARDLDRFWQDIPSVAEGQYVVVRASKEAVELITDPLGMEPVYYARFGEGWLVANSVTLLLRIIGHRPINLDAASFFLCQSWVPEDWTLRESVRVIPGGQRWRWRCGENVPDVEQYFGIRDLTGLHRPDLEELGADLVGQVKALGMAAGLIECPITSGKDSRLLMALVLRAGVEATYFTAGGSSTADVIAGQAITRTLGVPHELRPYTSTDLAASWETTSRALLEQTDGLVNLWYLDNFFLGQLSAVTRLSMQLWGIGGEMARGNWSQPKVVLGLQNASAALSGRMAYGHEGLLRSRAVNVAAEVVRRFASRALAVGVVPGNLADAFKAAQYMPRAHGSQGRNSRSTGDYFSPYCTRRWLIAAFGLSPARRMTEPLHYDLLRRLRPDLHALPLAIPWRPRHPAVNLGAMVARSALKRVGPWLPDRLRSRPKPGPVHHGPLLEAKLGALRERCLDRPRSLLWELVSRERFEQLTAPGSPAVERGRRIGGLYNILTMFEYEALPLG